MAAAALPAEQLSEQAASLAADRLKRQQATHAAVMTVKKVHEGELNWLLILQKSCCWDHSWQYSIFSPFKVSSTVREAALCHLRCCS